VNGLIAAAIAALGGSLFLGFLPNIQGIALVAAIGFVLGFIWPRLPPPINRDKQP
jgi:hypothetical protein